MNINLCVLMFVITAEVTQKSMLKTKGTDLMVVAISRLYLPP